MKKSLFPLLVLGCLLSQGCFREAKVSVPSLFPTQAHQKKPSDEKQQGNSQYQTSQNMLVLFLQNNPEIRRLRLEKKQLLANSNIKKEVENPEFRVTTLSPSTFLGETLRVQFRMRWKPPFPSELSAESARIKYRAYERLAMLRKRFWQKLANFQVTCLRSFYLQQRISLLRKVQSYQEKLVGTSKQALSSGAQTILNHQYFVIESNKNKQKLQLLEWKRQQAQSRLQQWTVTSQKQACRPEQVLAQIKKFQQTKHKWWKRHPHIKYLQALYQQANAELWLAKQKRIPWFSFLQVGYDLDETTFQRAFTFGIGFTLPLFSWNGSTIQAKQVAKKTTKQQIKLFVRSHERQLQQQWKLIEQMQKTTPIPALQPISSTIKQNQAVSNIELLKLRIKRLELRAIGFERKEEVGKLTIRLTEALAFRFWKKHLPNWDF